MIGLFVKCLNMSISAAWLVLAVVLLRQLMRKAPKWIICVLWGIVALRLLLPFHFESVFSLIPSPEVIPQNILAAQTPAIYSGIPAVNNTVNPIFTQHFTPETHLLETVLQKLSVAWLAGAAVMLLSSAVSYWRVRRKVRASLRMQDNMYVCDEIDTPFILGILRPRIYIPSGMTNGQLQCVLAHENAHLKRLDHLWKPLGFLLLTAHWFNPLLWLAYILLCRDVEQACDEKVIARMDNSGKKAYSEALLACSVHRRLIMVCPVAFGEIGVRRRIKGILSYKRPSFWIILAAAVVCLATAVCFLTDPLPCSHAYSSEITLSSTCVQKGVETFTCRLCGHSYTVHADLLAHNYERGAVLAEPDCVHKGSRALVCTGCGDVQTEAVEKTDHSFGEPFLTKEPDCAEKGEMSARCSHCHAVQVVEILTTNQNHNLHELVLRPATCEVPGEGVILCSRCGYEEKCSYAAAGHDYTVVSIIDATCRRPKKLEMRCTDCNEHVFYDLPEYGEHSWSSIGAGRFFCSICGLIRDGNADEGGSRLFGAGDLPYPPGQKIPWLALPVNWEVFSIAQ